MTLTITQLYQLISDKTDQQTAEVLTSYISEKVKSDVEERSKILATKEDIYQTKKEIQQVKVDMLKWFFAMFISLALMIIGLYFLDNLIIKMQDLSKCLHFLFF